MDHLQVQTTTDSADAAQEISRVLVGERLAACVQVVGPITSTYWWDDAVQVEQEWLCLIKTTADRYEALATRLREIHSYDVPEITALPITRGSSDYLGWIDTETAVS